MTISRGLENAEDSEVILYHIMFIFPFIFFTPPQQVLGTLGRFDELKASGRYLLCRGRQKDLRDSSLVC